MATIVTHLKEGGRFVVIGASFTHWKSARAHRFFGAMFPVEEEGGARVLTVAGADGKIQVRQRRRIPRTGDRWRGPGAAAQRLGSVSC